jgi:hypothetical protein
MTMLHKPFETLEGQGAPAVRQVSVFAENRVGQLLRITELFVKEDIRILALSVVESGDCAIVRMLFDSADKAAKLLREAGFAISVAEVVVVRLPKGKRGLLTVWAALLGSEVNIAYAYPLLPSEMGSAIALYVDSTEIAIDTLRMHGFEVLDESDLQNEP